MNRLLVLGGGSDIGLAIARQLVQQRGVTEVVLAARRPDELSDRVEELASLGAQVATTQFDLLDEDHVGFVERVVAEHGDLDVVVLAGAVLGDQWRAEHEPEHLRHVLQVNFVGAASISMAVVDRLVEQGTGTLVVLSTIAALQPRRANFVYGASKAGLDAFARGLSDLAAGSGAGVLVVRPGFVRSAMTEGMEEAPFSQDPADVATAVLHGLDSGRTVVHTSAPVAVVGKVLQALPRPVLRRLPR